MSPTTQHSTREVRTLLAAEASDDRAPGIAGLAEMGFEPGQGQDIPPTGPRKRRKPKR